MLYMKTMMSYFESLVKLLIAAMFVMAISAGSAFASEDADEPATDPAPVVEVVKEAPAPEPVAEVKAEPVAETPAPAPEVPAPVAETPAPVAETPAPAVETPAPVAETPAPAAEEPAPVVEAPAAETPAPAAQPEAEVAAEPVAEAPAAESEAAAPAEQEAAVEAAAPAAAAATTPAPKAAAPAKSAAKNEPVLKTAATTTTKVLGQDILAENGVFNITESGRYSLTGESENRISIIGEIQVYLQLINAKINAGVNASAISLSEHASAEITIEGACELVGKNGIAVPSGTSLTLIGNGGRDGGDSLVATGNGNWGCGIGFYDKDKKAEAGNITIKDLSSVIATGGKYNGGKKDEGGVGIGGGRTQSADQGIIVIDNVGSVVARGGSLAAGIGAGFWKACDVYINNSVITEATGGSSAPGIGGGRNVISGGVSSITWDEDKQAFVVSNPALVTNIKITDSEVHAFGGGTDKTKEGGAGIGVGYVDLSVGDYGRLINLIEDSYGMVVGSDVLNPEVHIVIDGASEVYAKGGIMSAGIGGGYKASVSSIFIGGETHVEATAGDTGSVSAKAIPCAIGSGAGGSGVFSDADGSITIESGAEVLAYAYGFEKIGLSRLSYDYDDDGRVLITRSDNYDIGDISHFINDKWAIGLGFDSSATDSSIIVFRFLNRDFFKELLDGYEGVKASDDMVLILTNADGVEALQVPLKAGYGSVAFTLPEGLYSGAIGIKNADGSITKLERKLTALPVTGYSAVTDGRTTGKTQTVFYGGEDSADPEADRSVGDYIDFTHDFYSYNAGTDIVNVHYGYGSYLSLLTFEAKKGINAFDAVAVRPLGTLTINHEFAIDGDDAEIPDTLEFVVTNPDGTQRVFKYADVAAGQGTTVATAGTVRLVIEDAVPGTYTVTERGWDISGYKHAMNINGAEAVSGESSYQIEFVWNGDRTLRSVGSAAGSYVDIYIQEASDDPETPGNTEVDPITPTVPGEPEDEPVVPTTPVTNTTTSEEEVVTSGESTPVETPAETPANSPAETPADEPVNSVATPNVVTPATVVAGAVPVALAAVPAAAPATAIPDDATPMAAAEEAIEDDGNALGAFDSEDENCWVHWWMMLGMALTALYGAAVAFRRQRNSSNLQKMDDEVMGKEEEAAQAAAPAMTPQPAL